MSNFDGIIWLNLWKGRPAMKKPAFITLFFIISFLFSGCMESKSKQATYGSAPESSRPGQTGYLTVSPVNLFDGDAAKFRAFLGPMSGAVKLKYKGNKPKMKLVVEVWQNGIKAQTVGEMTGDISRQTPNVGGFDGEFAISVKERNNDGKKPHYMITAALLDGTGSTSSEFEIEKNPKMNSSVTLQLNDDLQVPDSREIAIWGMQATDENGISASGSIDEASKKAKWALICRVSLVE
jgi:hypothetical protein